MYHMGLLENVIPPTRQSVFLFFFFFYVRRKRIKNVFCFLDSASSHIPKVETIEGLMNLIRACILVILGNVLDFRTYKSPNEDNPQIARMGDAFKSCDINAIPFYERTSICYARGVALRLFDWIRQCAIVKDSAGELVEDLPSLFLVQITRLLLTYKKEANACRRDEDVDHSLPALLRQVENVIDMDKGFANVWSNSDDKPTRSFDIPNLSGYSVQWVHDTRFNASVSSSQTCEFLFLSFVYLLIFFNFDVQILTILA